MIRRSKNSLFNWCVSSYAAEIHCYLKRREIKAKKLFFRSPQLDLRPQLIDWVRYVSTKFHLSNVTVHCGVRLIDLFMDSHFICENRLPTICIVSLLIAAKYEEEDSKIPKVKDLITLLGDGTTGDDLRSFEKIIMEAMTWDVGQVTAAHFAEYYMLFAIVMGDSDHFGTSHRHLQDLVRSSLRDFLDLSLSKVCMNEFMFSKIAATCLLAARLEHGVIPVWPQAIATLTGYSLSSLQPCIDLLTEDTGKVRTRTPSEDGKSESGYESASPYNINKKRILSRH